MQFHQEFWSSSKIKKNAKIDAAFYAFLNFFAYDIDVDIKWVKFDSDIDNFVVLKQQSASQFSSETLILAYHFIISSWHKKIFVINKHIFFCYLNWDQLAFYSCEVFFFLMLLNFLSIWFLISDIFSTLFWSNENCKLKILLISMILTIWKQKSILHLSMILILI